MAPKKAGTGVAKPSAKGGSGKRARDNIFADDVQPTSKRMPPRQEFESDTVHQSKLGL